MKRYRTMLLSFGLALFVLAGGYSCAGEHGEHGDNDHDDDTHVEKAHEDDEHAEKGHGHEKKTHAKGPAKTIEKKAHGYKYVLKIKPKHPTAQSEVEFEIDILKLGGDEILGGDPVEDATVSFRYYMPGMKMHGDKERHEAHAEASAGVYGHHRSFAHGGKWMLEVTAKTHEKNLPKMTFKVQVGDKSKERHEEEEHSDEEKHEKTGHEKKTHHDEGKETHNKKGHHDD